MRDPAPRIDPKSESAIEDTCRFLKPYMQSELWRADSDGFAEGFECSMSTAATVMVKVSDLPDWAKRLAIEALLTQAKKRQRGQPRRRYRDQALERAAMRLVLQGYRATRNDVTLDKESASSIIHRSLQRLGEKLSEKSVNGIVANACRDVLKNPASAKLLRRVLK
jgi:hypothetical protein